MIHPSLGLIVLAAGSSQRMNGVDKVWAPLGSHPVLWHSLARLGGCATEVVLVTREGDQARARRELGDDPNLRIVAGGAQRQDSVAAGLAALSDVDMVAVHDAARPFASAAMIVAGFGRLSSCDGAIPATGVTDTIKRVDLGGQVVQTLPRADLRAIQTPQVFRGAALREAHRRARPGDASATDDAALLERAGFSVGTFPGEASNLKVTTATDLEIARFLLERGLV